MGKRAEGTDAGHSLEREPRRGQDRRATSTCGANRKWATVAIGIHPLRRATGKRSAQLGGRGCHSAAIELGNCMRPQMAKLVYPVFHYGLQLKERLDRGEALDLETEQVKLRGYLQSE